MSMTPNNLRPNPYSRLGVVAVLVAAELAIVGIGAAIVGAHPWRHFTGGYHQVSFTPRTFEPIDAGTAPQVRIDDGDSFVDVVTSDDGKVHVTDRTRVYGAVFSAQMIEQLRVTRTADGVSIARSSAPNIFVMGGIDQRIEVAVPPGAHLDIAGCSGANVAGVTGSLRARSSDGAIEARGVAGAIDVHSDDGHVTLDGVDATALNVSSDDGSIRIRGLRLTGNNNHVSSSDGSLHVAFTDAGNVAVHAQTDDGTIDVNGRRSDSDDDSTSGDYTFGTASGNLNLSTDDGSITLTTNGVS